MDRPRSQPSRRRSAPRIVALVVALVVAVGVIGGCGGGDDEGSLPDATLVPLGGTEQVAVADLAPEGTPRVVNVWASWCVPCIKEMPAFEEVHQEMGDRVAIVGVTDDREAPALELAEQTGVTYPLYRDVDRTLLPDLGVAQLPATVFVDADGTIVERHQGDMTADELRGTIERLWGTS